MQRDAEVDQESEVVANIVTDIENEGEVANIVTDIDNEGEVANIVTDIDNEGEVANIVTDIDNEGEVADIDNIVTVNDSEKEIHDINNKVEVTEIVNEVEVTDIVNEVEVTDIVTDIDNPIEVADADNIVTVNENEEIPSCPIKSETASKGETEDALQNGMNDLLMDSSACHDEIPQAQQLDLLNSELEEPVASSDAENIGWSGEKYDSRKFFYFFISDIDLADPTVEAAATKIQSAFKGYKTRKKIGNNSE